MSRSPAANPACPKIRIGLSGTDLQASSKSVGDHSTADSGQPTSAPQNHRVHLYLGRDDFQRLSQNF